MQSNQRDPGNTSTQMLRNADVEQVEQKQPQSVPFFKMFRFADRTDYILMAVGTIASLGNGASMPLFALLWGDMIDSFKTADEMTSATLKLLLMFIYIGIAVFGTGWIMIACWTITGERQSIKCRKQYLKSLLRQEIGWFDLINQAQLSSQFSSDTMSFQGAVSDKVPLVLYIVAMGVSGIAIAFAKGWLLTLVLLGVFPAILGGMYLYMYHVQNKGKRQAKSYAVAGGRAEQALYAIKTIKMMNGQNYQSSKYDHCLKGANEGAIKFGIFTGVSVGGTFFAMLCAYSLGFWYGANCINETERCLPSVARQQYSAGIIFTCFFSVIIVGFNLSQLPPSLKKITQGRTAAGRIFQIIDRQPRITNPPNGIKIQNFKGVFKFHNVHFSYPKQPNKKILNGLNLQINRNKVAFVGQSGCGKSTILQLIMRFYDPTQGYITLDGYDLKAIDLQWLRQVVGYVGQEPVLFATSIRQNLLFAKENATEQQMQDALRKAEALEFVNQLEDKLDTNVGLGGGQISGGQKQRIAIARAILKDPKILLLDEATSALDRKNEKYIQRTLNKISQARISITIAHRVKTIMSSDQIFVIDQGKLKERGRFQDLSRFQGIVFEKEEQNQPVHHVQHPEEKLQKLEVNQQKKLTKEEKEKKEKQELMEVYNKNTYSRVFAYAKGKQILFVIGILSSGILGAVYPVFSIFLSSMLQIMLTKKNFIDEASTKALIFFLLGVLGLLMSILQNVCFEIIGGDITAKIRSQVFYKMMKLPVFWFERPKNSVGSLTSRLAVDCKQVKQMTTTYIYGLIQNLSSLLTGIVIAFIYEWRTSLVALGLIPFLIAAGAIRMAFRTGAASKAEQTYKQSSNIIMESMTNIRTVCSFGYENIIYNKYSKMLQIPEALSVKNGTVSGFFYGIAQFIMFIVIALIFYLGSLFVYYNGVSIDSMFTAVFAIFFSAMTVGNNSHILPDMAECKISAANLFMILDTKDQDQLQIDQNSKMLKKQIHGDFIFENIKFKYENRNEYLFNDFNLTIPFGQKVAFVGTSGCGKSTLMSFLLRFYMPESGRILLDGVDIKDFDIHHLRSQFGVVSQEPILFNASFRENIIYNMEASQEQMIQAAKKAYAYDFIMDSSSQKYLEIVPNNNKNVKNPKNNKSDETKVQQKTGFDRGVGIKGSHISGGQKQRVAVARAILRKPQILLLDEATSALDSVNQKKVQECLDEIMVGKSSISIAHRLDTIRNSKLIYVFDKGRVAEAGNYNQLMAKRGYFYNLEQGIEFK